MKAKTSQGPRKRQVKLKKVLFSTFAVDSVEDQLSEHGWLYLLNFFYFVTSILFNREVKFLPFFILDLRPKI